MAYNATNQLSDIYGGLKARRWQSWWLLAAPGQGLFLASSGFWQLLAVSSTPGLRPQHSRRCFSGHAAAFPSASDLPPCPSSFVKLVSFTFMFLAVLGVRCCAQAFSSCGAQGLLCAVVRGIRIAVGSLAVVPGL